MSYVACVSSALSLHPVLGCTYVHDFSCLTHTRTHLQILDLCDPRRYHAALFRLHPITLVLLEAHYLTLHVFCSSLERPQYSCTEVFSSHLSFHSCIRPYIMYRISFLFLFTTNTIRHQTTILPVTVRAPTRGHTQGFLHLRPPTHTSCGASKNVKTEYRFQW